MVLIPFLFTNLILLDLIYHFNQSFKRNQYDYKIKNWLTVMAMVAAVSNSSCALDEYNPSGYTMDALSNSVEGYQTILNNIYFGMERAMYGYGQFMWMTEGGTDIWTSQKNADNLWLRYGMGSDLPII